MGGKKMIGGDRRHVLNQAFLGKRSVFFSTSRRSRSNPLEKGGSLRINRRQTERPERL
jgi:hypothetical protein